VPKPSERKLPYGPGRPLHLPTREQIASWCRPTGAAPLVVLFSGCLSGRACGVDGTTYGEHPAVAPLLSLPNVRVVAFCPEEVALGTPRHTPNLYGGDGFDVLAGRASVRFDDGQDVTARLMASCGELLALARAERVALAVLMDVSAVCGSQVVYDGPRHLKVYRRGPGLAAAMLVQAGIPVVSQRDLGTLAAIYEALGHPELAPQGRDHHESEWFRAYFGASRTAGPSRA
jgi:uncharacterized protein YbbK (DUF523 family)